MARANHLPLFIFSQPGNWVCNPEGCIVIEDSRNGVVSARSAGMFCIGLRNGFNEEQDLSSANLIVNSLKEIDLHSLQQVI